MKLQSFQLGQAVLKDKPAAPHEGQVVGPARANTLPRSQSQGHALL